VLHKNVPGGKQEPLQQVSNPEHELPQAPQFEKLVRRLTQVLPQAVRPVPQLTHAPDWHSWFEPHLLAHVPQLFTSVARVAQVPPQLAWPAGHWQTPAAQAVPPVQTFPQAPQLLLSLWVARQVPLHTVRPAGQSG
jgi:hypothetical protein